MSSPRLFGRALLFALFCAPGAAAAEAATPEAATPEAMAPTYEVNVAGTESDAERLQNSAEAVTVVETKKARHEAADLGEVLARTPGIGVRREGGLGSDADISMNGFQGDQVRLFLDGVPLELAGYPFGMVNVPVALVERIEVYRGVVPIRFGADALGGAINLVTDSRYETHADASYQVGSFGTVRATAAGRHRDDTSGLVLGGSAFFDSARNDYWMHDRELPLPGGGTNVQSVRRFHDGYHALGGNLEAGVLDQSFAKRLSARLFFATFEKELQHNPVMSVPYGEANHGETTYGAQLRYAVEPVPRVLLELLANYTYRRVDFNDMSTHVYRWTGDRGRPVGRAGTRGELKGEAIDQSFYEHSWYARVGLEWSPAKEHTLRVSATPQLVTRVGDDHVPNRVDLLGLHDRLLQVVGGAEYELNLFDQRLSNIAFGKVYVMDAVHEQRPDGASAPVILEIETEARNWGAGDALRFRFTPWLLGKISYEYVTRLPRPDEIFGDGVLVEANGDLRPETSHNANLGPRLELERTPAGDFLLDANGFLRNAKDLIILFGSQLFGEYANIADMRALGVEGALTWVSPRRFVSLDGSVTYQDLRNTSTVGPFAPMNGMRIPTRPYFFASWGARLRAAKLPFAFEPFYYGHYMHGFDRGWAIGNPEYKISMPSQVSHAAGVTYSLTPRWGGFTATFEVDNLTDARLYDYFGVERPGRSFSLKMTARL